MGLTKLNRPVRREVRTSRGGALVVMLAPEGLWLREKGRRTAFLLPYGVGYQVAARMAAEERRRERKAARTQVARSRRRR